MTCYCKPAVVSLLLRCSLSIHALQLMSAHVYTLLGDLRVITTGILNYLVLDKQLSSSSVVSLCLLIAGIPVGQITAMDTTIDPTPGTDSYSWLTCLGLMLAIAMLSAVASVYTEWVMTRSVAL